MLLSTAKFQDKADEVTKDGLEHRPIVGRVEKIMEGSASSEAVTLEGRDSSNGGMMLYTSGTTNRPVRRRFHLQTTDADR